MSSKFIILLTCSLITESLIQYFFLFKTFLLNHGALE